MGEVEKKEKEPTIFKKIGGITYRVKVHFNEKASEDMQQKIYLNHITISAVNAYLQLLKTHEKCKICVKQSFAIS